jgi:hypothetical protein
MLYRVSFSASFCIEALVLLCTLALYSTFDRDPGVCLPEVLYISFVPANARDEVPWLRRK